MLFGERRNNAHWVGNNSVRFLTIENEYPRSRAFLFVPPGCTILPIDLSCRLPLPTTQANQKGRAVEFCGAIFSLVYMQSDNDARLPYMLFYAQGCIVGSGVAFQRSRDSRVG